MKVLEKMKLVDDIARALQGRFTFLDISEFLLAFNIDYSHPDSDFNSKYTFVKHVLKGASNETIKGIASELDISTNNIIKTPPKNWENTNVVKVFISHIAKDKKIATRLRDVFEEHNVDAFVAHEDIKPSEEWQVEIERALKTMDFFVSLHTTGFKKSIWCQQEIGYAACMNVKMIPIKFEEDPQGFIGKIQALGRGGRKAEAVVEDIIGILKDDVRTRDLYQEKIAPSITEVDDFPF